MTSRPVPRALIQIAGVLDLAEGRMLVSHGVDWLGWPLRLPVNAEDLSEPEAARLVTRLPPTERHVLITYENTAAGADAFCRQLGVQRIQLHGRIPADELRRLRERRPDLCIIKSLVVSAGNEASLHAMVRETAPWVDAFITDTFDPRTGAEGATGQVHDWDISRRLVETSPCPVILAGGLTPSNVAAAIRHVRPAGVDVHTGVEGDDGRKDPDLVARFVAEARAAFQDTAGEEHHV
jgi:phosphoribosylanthranilate isomerase